MIRHTRLATAALLLLTSGCIGNIGDVDSDEIIGPHGPEGSDPMNADLPIRILTASEIRFVLSDLFPGHDFSDVKLGPGRPDGKFSTFAELQAVSFVSHQTMEKVFEGVADRVVEEPNLFLGCDPEVDALCVETFLRDFGSRAFRRAFDEEEVTRFTSLYTALRANGDVRSSTTGLVQALLLSPYFLYHYHEAPEGEGDADGRVRLRGDEIARRLSFLLWSSAPDDTLRAAADAGKLDTREGIRSEAERMMNDPRFARFSEAFLLQWLEVDNVRELSKDASRIPEWTPEIAADMAEEARAYAVAWGTSPNASFAELLTSNDRYLNVRLATFLGVEGVTSDAFEKTVVADPKRASGVFTLGGFLASHTAITGKFGPLYRGKWLQKRLLCGTIGSPDPDSLLKAPKEESVVTTREYHEKLIQMPVCGDCHSRMDAMAFSLESFDGAGRFRTMENGVPVDTSANVSRSGDETLDGDYADIVELSSAYAKSQATHDCFGQNLTEYAFGRKVSASSDDTQLAVGSGLADDGLREAMIALVTSAPFVSSLAPSKGDQ